MANKEMFGMAILTHGEDHGVLFTYDEEMYLNEYIDAIKMNQTLVGKPKVRRNYSVSQELNHDPFSSSLFKRAVEVSIWKGGELNRALLKK